MEKSFELKSIEKGSAKDLRKAETTLLNSLKDQTVRNLSYNIGLLSDLYEQIIYRLNKRYMISVHPESKTDRKDLLMKLFKQNIALQCSKTGKAVQAKILQQTDNYTEYTYEYREKFTLDQVYRIILSGRTKAPEIVEVGVIYRRFKNVVIVSEPVEPVEPVAPVAPVAPVESEKKKRERKPKKQAA